MDYEQFLRAKAQLAPQTGFDVDPAEINPSLFDALEEVEEVA